MDKQMKSGSQNWMVMLEENFAKLPPLPENVKAAIVQYAPILALVFGVLGILFGIGGMGVLGVLSPFAMVVGAGGAALTGILGSLIYLASSVVLLMAYPGLKARTMVGWKKAFYSELLSILGSLLGFNILGAIIGGGIGLYLLFQIKSHYK